MLLGFLAILSCQLVGEVIAYEASLPVPGPVLGMILMFVFLVTVDRMRGRDFVNSTEALTGSGDFILRNMSLLFVPAGVGVIQKIDVVSDYGIGLAIVIVASTIITLIVTVFAFLAGLKISERLLGKETDHE